MFSAKKKVHGGAVTPPLLTRYEPILAASLTTAGWKPRNKGIKNQKSPLCPPPLPSCPPTGEGGGEGRGGGRKRGGEEEKSVQLTENKGIKA